MNRIFKYAVAATLTGALALAAASPSEARGGRHAAAAIGFGVGALVGAAIANANSGYYYGPGYYYAPGPYAGPYAYEPEPVYVQPAPRRAYRGGGGCWVVTDSTRGYGYYGPCY